MEVSVWTLSVDQKNNAKGDTSNSGDRISQLPEDILSCILSILTMRDASKAKMLSPSWRHLSASTLNLHFDQSSLFGINDNKISISDTDGKLRFVKAVDQYLQQWRGPKIYSFKVCYTLGKEFAYHIDRWISSAINGQTEKLELIFSLYSIPSFGDQLYDFPCHLHSQAEAFRLKHLLLTYCSMSRAAFHSIFSGCINLKSFELRRCMLPVCVFICSPLHLESLIFENCEGADKIELSIDVTTFEYTGKMTDLRFVGAPFVEKVHLKILNPFERGTNYMFNGLAKELPQLQILSLSCFTKELDPVPANMARFSHLKELELLVYLYPHFDLLSVALILNATPCLQKFHLALNHSENRRKLQKCVFGKQFYYKLKKVEISGFRDRCNALDLAVYLLNSAVRLEQMIIDIGKSWKLGFNGWYYEKKHSSYENDKKHVHDVLSKENPNVKISVL